LGFVVRACRLGLGLFAAASVRYGQQVAF